jgi:catechol 2,3-dioxygenase-like lactoylglutathione lyase family enzyme
VPDIVILAVTDLASAVALYTTGLGMRPVVESPHYVELAEGVGLYERAGFARNIGEAPEPSRGVTGTELYFRVPDLTVACARLVAAGARTLSAAAPRPWGEEVAYYADLDGNVIALAKRP